MELEIDRLELDRLELDRLELDRLELPRRGEGEARGRRQFRGACSEMRRRINVVAHSRCPQCVSQGASIGTRRGDSNGTRSIGTRRGEGEARGRRRFSSGGHERNEYMSLRAAAARKAHRRELWFHFDQNALSKCSSSRAVLVLSAAAAATPPTAPMKKAPPMEAPGGGGRAQRG